LWRPPDCSARQKEHAVQFAHKRGCGPIVPSDGKIAGNTGAGNRESRLPRGSRSYREQIGSRGRGIGFRPHEPGATAAPCPVEASACPSIAKSGWTKKVIQQDLAQPPPRIVRACRHTNADRETSPKEGPAQIRLSSRRREGTTP